MPSEPTLYDLVRRIDDLREDIVQLTGRFDRYILREVYAADQRERDRRFQTIEEELRRNRSTRILLGSLAVTAIIGPILTGVVVFLMTRSLT